MEFNQQEGNNDFAVSRFESMLESNNILFFDSTEFEDIIQHYLEIGKINFVKKAIKIALEQHPYSVTLKLYKAEILIFDNKFSDAETILHEIYSIEPNNEEIYIQQANIYSKKNQNQKAINTLKIALDLNPDEEGLAELYALIGMEYLFLDKYVIAKKYFEKCLELDPEDSSSLYNIIYCFEYEEDSVGAIKFLNKYIDINPYSEIAWHQLGKQYVQIEEFEKSITCFDFAIISDETFVGAYIEKGNVLEKLEKFSSAIENYKISLSLEDPTSYALLRIGKCYLKLKNNTKALEYFYKTVHEDPMLDKAWFEISSFYSNLKNYNKALYYINQALDLDNENIDYWINYSEINTKLSLFEEAAKGLKNALDLGNYELSNWLKRVDLLIKLGDFNLALSTLKEAKEFYPEDNEILYREAGCLLNTLNYTEGKKVLKKALELNSENKLIIEYLFPNLLLRKSISDLIK